MTNKIREQLLITRAFNLFISENFKDTEEGRENLTLLLITTLKQILEMTNQKSICFGDSKQRFVLTIKKVDENENQTTTQTTQH